MFRVNAQSPIQSLLQTRGPLGGPGREPARLGNEGFMQKFAVALPCRRSRTTWQEHGIRWESRTGRSRTQPLLNGWTSTWQGRSNMHAVRGAAPSTVPRGIEVNNGPARASGQKSPMFGATSAMLKEHIHEKAIG